MLRKGREPSPGLEALAWFSQFDISKAAAGSSIHDLDRIQEVTDTLKSGLAESLANSSRLHGWRAQGLFAAVLVELGWIQLIKDEDAGLYYYDDLGGKLKPPDFRVVDQQGNSLLIEVKTTDPTGSLKPFRMRSVDFDALGRYASMVGSRLLFAIYWPGLNLWTLVDARVLRQDGKRRLLPIDQAMKVNELGLLGDGLIGTEPPLQLTLVGDPNLSQNRHDISATEWKATFQANAVEISSNGRALEDHTERQIAWFLMLFGDWDLTATADTQDGQITRLNYTFTPSDENMELARAQGFAFIGTLSSMYSARYNAMTLADDGAVKRLRQEPTPEALARLIPDDYWNRTGRSLRLWRLNQRPLTDEPRPSGGA